MLGPKSCASLGVAEFWKGCPKLGGYTQTPQKQKKLDFKLLFLPFFLFCFLHLRLLLKERSRPPGRQEGVFSPRIKNGPFQGIWLGSAGARTENPQGVPAPGRHPTAKRSLVYVVFPHVLPNLGNVGSPKIDHPTIPGTVAKSLVYVCTLLPFSPHQEHFKDALP